MNANLMRNSTDFRKTNAYTRGDKIYREKLKIIMKIMIWNIL